MTQTQYLDRPGGRIAYDDSGGSGSLVIAAPGMGDTRAVYRHVRAPLVEAGFRFVTMDLRGMGESTAHWNDLSDGGVASDYLALIDELDAGPAVLVGSSLACGSAVIAATQAPESVAGLAVIGPFVRQVPQKWWQKAVFATMLAPPWGRTAWVSYYRTNMYPGAKPPDHDEYVAELSRNLAEKGRMASLRSLASNTHVEAGQVLTQVTQPTVVVMGTADPDFPDPVGEARELAEILSAELLLVDGSGHYPQADRPEIVAPAIIDLVRRTNPPPVEPPPG